MREKQYFELLHRKSIIVKQFMPHSDFSIDEDRSLANKFNNVQKLIVIKCDTSDPIKDDSSCTKFRVIIFFG